jgi:hypothetical protein
MSHMKAAPKVVGYVEIPTHLKDYGNSIPKRLVHELLPGKALLLELESPEAADHYHHCVLNAGLHEFGSGHVQTATEGAKLYVWLRHSEPDPLAALSELKKEHFKGFLEELTDPGATEISPRKLALELMGDWSGPDHGDSYAEIIHA